MKVLLLVLLTGCTLSEYKAPGGDDGSGSGSGSGAGPVGKTFLVERITTFGSPACPFFSQENEAHSIVVEPALVRVDGIPSQTETVRNTPANDETDPPNVVFTANELWSSFEGSVEASIRYELFIDGTFKSGTAMTFFVFDSPETGPLSCNYTWTVF